MQVVTIDVDRREVTGTRRTKALRDSGKIPIMLCGRGQESVMLSADYAVVRRHLAHHLRVYKLNMSGKTQAGYLKEVQWDVLTDEPLHMDFLRIEMDEPLKLQVSLRYLGHAKGVTAGGTMMQDLHTVNLACLPDRIPEDISLRIDALDIGDHILVGDLELPEGCTLDMPVDTVLCHVRAAKKEDEPDAEEGVEPVVGDAAAAPAGDTPPAEG